MFLDRNHLQARSGKRRYKEVPLASTGEKARIRSLTELERSRFENSALTKKGELSLSKLDYLKQRLIVLCLVDADGNPVLSDADVASSWFNELDSAITDELYTECKKHTGVSDEDIEELVKNSEAMSGAASPSC